MNIGILGTGSVGQALGAGWAAAGHSVVLGSRNPSGASTPSLLHVLGLPEAVDVSEVVVLAVPYPAVQNIVRVVGSRRLAEKIVIDVTNPIERNPFASYLGLAIGWKTSGAEELARLLPGGHVVKAFNTMFAEHMGTGQIDGERVTLFVAGDDAETKRTVIRLGQDLGLDPVDAGPLLCARFLEPMGLELLALSNGLGPRHNLAYRILRKGRALAFRVVRSPR